MAYCGPRGIPHSEFLAWPIDDQAKALGWMAEESQKCSGCGVPAWDDHNLHTVDHYVCPTCARIENVRDSLTKDRKKPIPGQHIRVMRDGGAGGRSRPQGPD